MNFEVNLKKMYSEFTDEQRVWFQFSFPKALYDWFNGDFNGKQLSKNPKLIEDYLQHNVSLSSQMPAGQLDNFLMALWCVRKCYGQIHAPTLYRLTSIKDATEKTTTLTVRATNQLKPITSWSADKNIHVQDRTPTQYDFIIRADNVPSRFILGSTEILLKTIRIVLAHKDFFELHKLPEINPKKKLSSVQKRMMKHRSRTAEAIWTGALRELRVFESEREYMLYLNSEDSLKAAVEYKVTKDSHHVDEFADSPKLKATKKGIKKMVKVINEVTQKPQFNPLLTMSIADLKKEARDLPIEIEALVSQYMNAESPEIAKELTTRMDSLQSRLAIVKTALEHRSE